MKKMDLLFILMNILKIMKMIKSSTGHNFINLMEKNFKQKINTQLHKIMQRYLEHPFGIWMIVRILKTKFVIL